MNKRNDREKMYQLVCFIYHSAESYLSLFLCQVEAITQDSESKSLVVNLILLLIIFYKAVMVGTSPQFWR
jgi:hypothetical protein